MEQLISLKKLQFKIVNTFKYEAEGFDFKATIAHKDGTSNEWTLKTATPNNTNKYDGPFTKEQATELATRLYVKHLSSINIVPKILRHFNIVTIN